jgi:hypothetical protein
MQRIGRCLRAATHNGQLLLIFVSMCMTSPAGAWTVNPSYESPPGDTSLKITNEQGQSAEIYTESHAILILEADYKYNAVFPSAHDAAIRAITLLRPKLEADRFHVLIWMNLSSTQLKTTIDEVFGKYGYVRTGRMFFYYFGHGEVTGDEDDPPSMRAWLVPVDAPDPIKKEMKFYRLAIPMSYIVAQAQQALIKHAFFAFEACRAGYVITSLATLGGLKPPHIKGYVLSPTTQEPVRQFLTAGNKLQNVPANNSFTALLAGALVDPAADTNEDGFVTGRKIIAYVALRLPQWATDYPLTPENGSYPLAGSGDMVFGPTSGRSSDTRSAARSDAAAGVPSAPPKEPALNPFSAVTGVNLNASIEDVRKRFPNGQSLGNGPNSGYRYSRRINTNDGSSMDLDVRLKFDGNKVNLAYVDSYADFYSGDRYQSGCVERHSVMQLINWYRDVWGAPVCFRQDNDDPNLFDIFFKRDNTSAYFLIAASRDPSSHAPGCIVRGWLNDHSNSSHRLLGQCLEQNR